jgi:pyruvate formate lyase activating enzyme
MAGGAATVTGWTFDTQRFCLHDGRGIRTTVFLKGCPLACLWCHNPESQSSRAERVWLESRCIGCGECVTACSRGAIRMEGNRPAVDRSLCQSDGACARVCPAGAMQVLGRQVAVEEVLRDLRRDLAVFDESGGGATFSGGEPLMQAEFLEALLVACRAEGIHTTVDTCGHAPWAVVERIGQWADAFLFDLKHPDDEAHRRLTGVTNEFILNNLSGLTAMRTEQGSPDLAVRVPLVAGLNDDESVAVGLAAVLSGLDPLPPVDLLPYQALGEQKYARLGREYPLKDARPPTGARLERFRDILHAAGVQVTIRGEEHAHH